MGFIYRLFFRGTKLGVVSLSAKIKWLGYDTYRLYDFEGLRLHVDPERR
jgi:hypothetical protein